MGHGPLGERRIVGIVGGTFRPELRGEVLAGRADWQSFVRMACSTSTRCALKDSAAVPLRVTSRAIMGRPKCLRPRGDEVDRRSISFAP